MLNRNRTGAVVLAAAMIFTSFATGCKQKKKNNERLIKKCTSEVDDYLMYLTKGKTEKLSKYIDPKEDPLQNLDSLPTSEKELSLTYISLLEYSIGETTIEDETATVIVTLTYPSAEEFLDTDPEPENLQALLKALRNFDETDEVDVEIILSCDEDEETCSLEDTTTVNDVVSEQVALLKDLVPDESKVTQKDIDRFMKAVISGDESFLMIHSNLAEDYDFEEEYLPLYTAETSFWTYEIECEPQTNDNEITFTLHMHIKDKKAAKDFIMTPKNLGPFVSPYYLSLISPDPNSDPDDIPGVRDLAPGLRSALEKAPTVDIDVTGTLTYRDSSHSLFYIYIDLSDVLPYEELLDFTNEYTEEQILEAYREGYILLHEDGKITDEQYHEFERALGEMDYDLESITTLLTDNGFTESEGCVDYLDTKLFTHKNGTEIEIACDEEYLEPFFAVYSLWQEVYDDLTYNQENYTGELTGDCLDFQFEGKADMDGTMTEIYMHVFVVQSDIYIVRIVEPNDEKLELVKTILEEAGID